MKMSVHHMQKTTLLVLIHLIHVLLGIKNKYINFSFNVGSGKLNKLELRDVTTC